MCAMQNNIDETMPSRPDKDPEEPSLIEGETQRVSVVPAEMEAEDAEYQILSLDGDVEDEDQTQEVATQEKHRMGRWIALGLAIFIVIVGVGAISGFLQGQGQRAGEATKQAAVEAVMQYQMGLDDLSAGRCDMALRRFQYVAQVNPSYPGLQEQLVAAQLCSQATTTPTPVLEPTATPTPDTRSVDQKFIEAQSLLAAKEWDALLDTLDSLRDEDPTYKAVQVDGMYYLALRNRGVDRILVQGDLEGGIYDLNRVQLYGPLDAEAAAYRDWASWYITGKSFWEVDWAQSMYYLNQVASVAPNLWDGSFFAQDRLATAQVGYSYDLIQQASYLLGLKGWCEADALFDEARQYAPLAPDIQPTAEWAAYKCELNPDEEAATPLP